jgi:hypothetical protein
MNEITVTYDPVVVDEFMISRRLNSRFLRRWPLRLAANLPMISGLAVASAASVLFGSGDFATDLWIALCTVIGVLIGNAVLLQIYYGQTKRLVMAHPYRRALKVNVVTASGAQRGQQTFVWSDVSDVMTQPGVTLLLLSPLDFIAFPDSSLPPGLSPEDLRARIAGWRAAAATTP